MPRYHINTKTGNPGICRAHLSCPFGDLEADHYEDKDTARAAYEEHMRRDYLLAKEAEIVTARDLINDKIEEAWTRVKSPYGGTSMEMNITREEYDAIVDELYDLETPLIAVRKELAGDALPPHTPVLESGFGLAEAQETLMLQVNRGYDYDGAGKDRDKYNFSPDVIRHMKETLARYYAGEVAEATTGYLTLTSDRLLTVLTRKDNSISSQAQMYAALVFPEKDLDPILKRLGVENVSVAPFYNTREWGLAYSVIDPEGNTRSFSIYEHRNTDSIIIGGATNWDPEIQPYGPYGAEESNRGKNSFFAEFAPDDTRQVAETLGFFLHEAQEGELTDDNTLVQMAEHRDWQAILSESVPGFKAWAEQKGYTKEKRWFED